MPTIREYTGRAYCCRIYNTDGYFESINTGENLESFIDEIIYTVNRFTYPISPLDDRLHELSHNMSLVAGAVNGAFLDFMSDTNEDFKKVSNFMTHIHVPDYVVYDGSGLGDRVEA